MIVHFQFRERGWWKKCQERIERKAEEEKEEVQHHLTQSQYGEFERSFNIPDNIDQTQIKASYLNGILTVILHKDEKAISKSIIEVQ